MMSEAVVAVLRSRKELGVGVVENAFDPSRRHLVLHNKFQDS